MRKIVLAFMLAFALVLGGCSGGGLEGMTSLDTTNNDYKFDNLQNQITELQNQIAALSGGSVSNETIIFLQTQINDLSAELEALRKQVNTDNVTIGGRLDELEKIVKELNGRLAVLEAASLVPVANPPMFVSAYHGDTEPETDEARGATIRWTGSAGGGTIVSYNVWAVTVDPQGFFGIPVKLANGTGSSYYWDGHTENLPGEPFVGVNPAPLSAVNLRCSDSYTPKKYRFAVTAVDSKGRDSSPSVTADKFIVQATLNGDVN